MILKIFRSVWFLSMVVMLVSLLYVYAGLPEEVIVQEDEASVAILPRDTFFYIVMIAGCFINVLVFLISKLMARDTLFRTWFYGFMVTLNFFMIISLFFVSVYNSAEKFDYGRISFIIYGSVGLIIAWALALPVLKIFVRNQVN
jgi:hypothetical protein